MTLTIELPDELGAALNAHVQAKGVAADRYVSRVLELALTSESPHQQHSEQPFETGYGMWAKYGSAPSAEQVDEARREMFHNFAQDL